MTSTVVRRFTAVHTVVLLAVILSTQVSHGALMYRVVALTGDAAPGAEPGVTFLQLTTPLNHNIMRPVIDDEGRVALIALLAGPGVDATNRSGIWLEENGVLSLVVRTGQPAPGAPAGAVFEGVPSDYLPFPPSFANGQVSFKGVLTGPGITTTNNDGVWKGDATAVSLVLRESDPAAGAAGTAFTSVSGAINDLGELSLPGTINGGGVTTQNNEGVWVDRAGGVQLLAREGDPAPGTGLSFGQGGIGARPSAFPTVVFNDNSEVAMRADLAGASSFNDEAMFVERNGQLELLFREGDPAPGVLGQATLGGNSVSLTLDFFAFNKLGHVAFNCRLGGSFPNTTAMFSDHQGFLTAIAFPGDNAPGTNFVWSIFGTPVLSDAGRIAFRAALPDEDGDPFIPPPFGIFWDHPGFIQPLVLPGEQILHDGEFFDLLGINAISGFNGSGQVTFDAGLDHPTLGWKSALLLAQSADDIQVVAATGDAFDVAGDGSDLRTIQRVVSGGLSENGVIAFRLDFVDGSSGHFTATATTVIAGDMNCDSDVNLADVPHFAEALVSPASFNACNLGNGDITGDGNVDGRDVEPFVELLSP